LKRVPGFCDQVEIVLVEASPALRAIQKARLEDSGARIRWTTHFDVSDVPLLLVANEFFDALPIRQYVKTARGWCERMVVLKEGALDFALAPQITPAAAIPASRAGAPEGGVYEVSPAATALIAEIARILAAHGGAALLLDYGYDSVGFGETLQAVREHQPQTLLADPGRSDLSAHVDFASLAEAARQQGAAVFGPKGQGAFLEALGLGVRARRLAGANPLDAEQIRQAAKRLTAPEEMGTLFQAMALSSSAAPPLPGF
jgi:SAM-dependent MidA family methyltransferase